MEQTFCLIKLSVTQTHNVHNGSWNILYMIACDKMNLTATVAI